MDDQVIHIVASEYNSIDQDGLNTGEIHSAEDVGTQHPTLYVWESEEEERRGEERRGEGRRRGEEEEKEYSLLFRFSEIFHSFGDVDNNFFLDSAKPWSKNQRRLHSCAKVYPLFSLSVIFLPLPFSLSLSLFAIFLPLPSSPPPISPFIFFYVF